MARDRRKDRRVGRGRDQVYAMPHNGDERPKAHQRSGSASAWGRNSRRWWACACSCPRKLVPPYSLQCKRASLVGLSPCRTAAPRGQDKQTETQQH